MTYSDTLNQMLKRPSLTADQNRSVYENISKQTTIKVAE